MTTDPKYVKSHELKVRLLRHMGQRGYGADGRPQTSRGKRTQAESSTTVTEGAGTGEIKSTAITSEVLDLQNEHPHKRTFKFPNPLRGFKLWAAKIKAKRKFELSVLFPKPTEEELEKRKAQQDALAVFNAVVADARQVQHTTSNVWKRLMFYDRPYDDKTKRPGNVRTPGFDVVGYKGGDWFEAHVDTREAMMPENVFLTTLFSDRIINEVQYSLDKPIRAHAFTFGGLIRYQRTGDNGITNYVSIQDLWARMPQNLPMLAWPVGRGENRDHYKNLEECPHVMFVGITKRGKSNAINAMICTYLYRGFTPQDIQFVLIDCKQGAEFGFYSGLPHLYIDEEHHLPGMVEELGDAVNAVDGLLSVMKVRMNTIKAAHCKSWSAYNLKVGKAKRMPALLVYFDDLIALTSIYGAKINSTLQVLIAQCRAAGMFCIIGAQYPKGDEVPVSITINIPVVIAMHLKRSHASRAMIGTDTASLIPDIPGRCVFSDAGDELELQIGHITDSTIDTIVAYAKSGKPIKNGKIGNRIDIEEVLEYALENFGGRLDHTSLYNAYRGRISFKKLVSRLKDADEHIYNIKGTMYLVTMKLGRPRRMVLPETMSETRPEETA